MPRRTLTDEEKQAMQSARVTTRAEQARAMEELQNNPQFTNPTFWKRVDPELFDQVQKAMKKTGDLVKKARIAKLEAELSILRS